MSFPPRTLRANFARAGLFLPGIVLAARCILADENVWTDVTGPLLKQIADSGREPGWPGGCSGVVVNRLNGDVTVKVVGQGLWRSSDAGATWIRLDGNAVSGRDETGWATSVDPHDPTRIVSFSLDGTAGGTWDGKHWKKFADVGRNWDYGSVPWSAGEPRTIIAARHETEPPGEVYVTTDGGETWRQLAIHLLKDRGKVSMIGALGPATLIYSRGEGIYRSSDTGATWSKVSDADPQTRIPVEFNGRHYLGTADGLLVSRDAGATWEPQGAAVDVWQGPFFGAEEKAILVVGKQGVYRTSDAGRTWIRVSDLKPRDKGFLYTPNWFGCYAWDPVNGYLYASAMGNPVYRRKLPR